MIMCLLTICLIFYTVLPESESLSVTGYKGYTQGCAIGATYDGKDTIYLLASPSSCKDTTSNLCTISEIWSYSLITTNFNVKTTFKSQNVTTLASCGGGCVISLNQPSRGHHIDVNKFTFKTNSNDSIKSRPVPVHFELGSLSVVANGFIFIVGTPNELGNSHSFIFKYNITHGFITQRSDKLSNTSMMTHAGSRLAGNLIWDKNGKNLFIFHNKHDKSVVKVIIINSTNLSVETVTSLELTEDILPSIALVVENTVVMFTVNYNLVLFDLRRKIFSLERLKYVNIDINFNRFIPIYIAKLKSIYIIICGGRILGCGIISMNMRMIVEETEPQLMMLEEHNVTLKCGIKTIGKTNFVWKKDNKNVEVGSDSRIYVLENGDLYIARAEVSDSGSYKCSAVNDFDQASTDKILDVSYRTVIRSLKQVGPETPGSKTEFNCVAIADESLKLRISWYKDEEPIEFNPKSRYLKWSENTIAIQNTDKTDYGNYTCVAETNLDSQNKTVRMLPFGWEMSQNNSNQDTAMSSLMMIVVTVISVFLLASGVLCYGIYRYNKAFILTRTEFQNFKYGYSPLNENTEELYTNGIPYDNSYELAPRTFDIQRESILGEGEFGIVYKGVVYLKDRKQDVAFKTTKQICGGRDAKSTQLKNMISELKVMIYIGDHPNIIKLVGAYTREIKSGIVYVAAEFCANGSLEIFLRRSNYTEQDAQNLEALTRKNKDEVGKVSDAMLKSWSMQIANGMQYLSSKRIIHSDLATRNVLVAADFSIRITDFGLSRRLETYSNYVKKGTEPMPWRWMAVESLDVRNFSSQSDVWSFGVTVWEMYSMGSIPYPGQSWTIDFVQKLKKGLRLPHPQFASGIIYKKMLECWNINPSQRPTFEQLHSFFLRKHYEGHEVTYLD